MASGAGPSRRPSSELFPRAALRILTSRGDEKKSCDVVLAISHRIYWKEVKANAAVGPLSLFDFEKKNSLKLTRLDATAKWSDVEDQVIPVTPYDAPGYGVTFECLIGDHKRWVELSTTDVQQRDKWLHEIRLRIAPWELLHRRARKLMANASEAMTVDELIRGMNALHVREVAEDDGDNDANEVGEVGEVASLPSPRPPLVHERIQKWDWVEKLNNHFASVTGVVAKVVGMRAEEGGDVSNTAKIVEDFAKMIPGSLSSVFHLIVLTARLVSMYAEASRGRKALPAILVKVGDLLQCVTESIEPILRSLPPAEKGELLLEGNVFEVLVTVFDMMGKVESQLLRSFQKQAKRSAVVSEIESKLDTLKMKVVGVVHTKRIREVERDIRAVKRKVESPTMSRILLKRPRKSAYFVGRGKELAQLEQEVGKYGSAAITGFGGLGKSQLMTAFADHVEASGDVSVDVYWVVADGNASKVIDALAMFVESLKGATIAEEERKKPEVVLSALKNVLSEASGRWLLCLDNVDNAGETEVRGILDEVAAMAEPTKSNGWVVVTSRSGHPTLWDSMKKDQNVVLSPLSVEDGMYVLWRYKKSIRSNEASDEEIAEALSQFEHDDKDEYEALRVLCGFGWDRSLAGLPLALIHAGAYIRQYGCSFSEYLKWYRESNEKSELEDILQKAEDLTLKREQRAILTTWSISMRRLSEEARLLVRAVAMLGNAPVPEDLVKKTLEGSGGHGGKKSAGWLGRMFRKVVLSELVFDSSLLRRYGNETESTFELHRLVRMFLLVEMRQDKEVQQNAFEKAVLAMHSSLDSILKKQKKSFNSWWAISDPQSRYFPHAVSLVNHFSSLSLTIITQHIWTVPQVFEFTGASLYWTRELKEAAVVQKNVLKLYRTIHGEDVNNSDVSRSMHCLGNTLRKQRKLVEAEEMYRKSLDMNYSIHGRDANHSDIAASLHVLGLVFQAQGKLGEAKEMYRKSLGMKDSIHGRDTKNGEIAGSLYALRFGCRVQGKLSEEDMMMYSVVEEYGWREAYRMQETQSAEERKKQWWPIMRGFQEEAHSLLPQLIENLFISRRFFIAKRPHLIRTFIDILVQTREPIFFNIPAKTILPLQEVDVEIKVLYVENWISYRVHEADLLYLSEQSLWKQVSVPAWECKSPEDVREWMESVFEDAKNMLERRYQLIKTVTEEKRFQCKTNFPEDAAREALATLRLRSNNWRARLRIREKEVVDRTLFCFFIDQLSAFW